MNSERPHPGWWLASDGNWYPPNLRPGLYPTTSTSSDHQRQSLDVKVFRTGAVFVSGIVDATIGAVIVIIGVALMLQAENPKGLPIGLAIAVLGSMFLFTGAGRMCAHLEVHQTKIVWTWMFSRHQLVFTDINEAVLTEKGSLIPPGDGMWWFLLVFLSLGALITAFVVGVIIALTQNGSTMGPYILTILNRHSHSVPIQAIGSWGTSASNSKAQEATATVNQAIGYFHEHFDPHGPTPYHRP